MKPEPGVDPSRTGQFRETVLLVDDEKGVRTALAHVLEEEGYRVLQAGDGEEALSVSEAFPGPIHLLVTDVMMPNMNGMELADRLCALRPDIKVLFISGHPRTATVPGDVCEDQVDWLAKPFNASRLNHKVRHLLDSVGKP